MNNKQFTEICFNKSATTFSYRSSMTVYEEGFSDGVFASLGWNGAGFTLNVLEGKPTYLAAKNHPQSPAFCFDCDGTTLRRGWSYESHEIIETFNGHKCKIKLQNSILPVDVYVCTELDGTAILSRWIEIKNNGNTPVKLGNITVMGGGLDSIGPWHHYVDDDREYDIYSLGYFEYSNWSYEGCFRWHNVPTARTTIESRYDFNRQRHPMFMLKNNVMGKIWFGQLGYSGGYAFDINLNTNNSNDELYSSFAARIDGENPTYILEAGKTFVSPIMHMGMMNGDLDDIVNEMHDHTRKSVFTYPAARGVDGGWIEGGMGAERSMTVEAVKHFADTMAAVGAETLIIDAGWYCPPGLEAKEWNNRVGDWDYNKELYPNGIEEIRDYVHSKGLLFGMWAEIERIGELSQAYAEHEHLLITRRDGTKTSILDMSDPEAVDFAEKALCRIIEEYKLDLYRIDYNITPDFVNAHYFNKNGENGIYRYYENLYALFDRIRKKYPDLVLENCAAGGSRTDLGLEKYFTHAWVSDNQKAPRSVAITNGMTMVLPPEHVDRLAGGMNSHLFGTLDLIIRHTLFGRPTTNTYNCMGSQMNTEQIEFVRHSYDIYKNVIRPFAPTGRIYHHTPEAYERQTKGTVVLERSARDKSVGVIGVFRLVGDNDDMTVVYPRGVDMSATYDVTFDNSGAVVRMSGYQMVTDGVRVRIGQNLASELVIYKMV
jgi:alpha-galactosidase